MRNLLSDAMVAAEWQEAIKIRENRGCYKARGPWAAWDCLYKAPDAKRGKCRLTLVHMRGTRFE